LVGGSSISITLRPTLNLPTSCRCSSILNTSSVGLRGTGRKALAYIDKQYNITKSRHGVAIAPIGLTPIQKEFTDYDAFNRLSSPSDDDDAFNRLSSPSDDDDDDLHRYKSARILAFGTDPLQWWKDNEHHYPVFKHLAFTYLAAPASSAANERLFSIAGNVINEERPHTQADLSEAVQCLRSWHENKLI
jgi:hypothetical protein